MARIEVDIDELRQLSAMYAREAAELQSRVHILAGKTEPLLVNWVGGTAPSFRMLAASVRSRQEALAATYKEMADALRSAANAYESIDSNISSAFDV